MTLEWSRDQNRNYNLKAVNPMARGESITLATVAFHNGENTWIVAPKLPGLPKSVPVVSLLAGQFKAVALCRDWFKRVGVSNGN